VRRSVPIRTGAPQTTANCSSHQGTCSAVVKQNTAVLKSTECSGRVETKALRPIAGYFNLLSIFRRVRIIAKTSITFITSVGLFVCISVAQIDGHRWNFMLGTSMKICRETFKFGQNRTKVSGTAQDGVSTFYYCRRHKFNTKAFLFITRYFCKADSDRSLNTQNALLRLY